MGQVGEDGRLQWAPVWPGRVLIQGELPDKDWRVVSVRVGRKILSKGEFIKCSPGERIRGVKILIGANLGVVAGKVISARDQSPIDGAWVHLWRQDKEKISAMPAQTNASGRFFFHSIPAGPYVVAVIRRPGKEADLKRKITVAPGGVVRLRMAVPGARR